MDPPRDQLSLFWTTGQYSLLANQRRLPEGSPAAPIRKPRSCQETCLHPLRASLCPRPTTEEETVNGHFIGLSGTLALFLAAASGFVNSPPRSVADGGCPGTAEVPLQPVSPSGGVNYYVSAETGDDTYDGTSPTHIGGNIGPWLTLHKAGLMAVAGATVHVADGTYEVDGRMEAQPALELKRPERRTPGLHMFPIIGGGLKSSTKLPPTLQTISRG